MKKKIALNKKLSLNKATIGCLNNEKEATKEQTARLTTIGRTCIPMTMGEFCTTGPLI